MKYLLLAVVFVCNGVLSKFCTGSPLKISITRKSRVLLLSKVL